MATTQRELIAQQLLHADDRQRRASKPAGAKPGGRPSRRHKQPRRLPSPSSDELEQREQGWNDRFVRDSPSQPKRPQRTHRSADDPSLLAGETTDQKEKRIQEERHQYGHGNLHRQHPPQRPGVNNRLVPIVGSLSLPPREPEMSSSKEEKLRFKVLQAIDIRETLIYQLNALILCTPVQEALVMAESRAAVNRGHAPPLKPRGTMALAPVASSIASGGAMSNAREATRLAQQLGSDLQITGIQVVEGLVEWMLEAGAKAEKPPTFLWRDRNYFLKMETDLDFAGPELRARGVSLDCFSTRNPLCVRPEQKLGRILAARSIIREMVEMARQQQQQLGITTVNGGGDVKTSGRKGKSSSSTTKKTPRDKATRHTPRNQEVAAGAVIAKPSSETAGHSPGVSADQMINLPDDEYDDNEMSTNNQHDSLIRDAETEKDLVAILDESLGHGELTSTLTPPAQESATAEVNAATGSSKSTGRDEYENSFDDEEPAADNADNGKEENPKSNQSEHTVVPPSVLTQPIAITTKPVLDITVSVGQAQHWEQIAHLLNRSTDNSITGTKLQQCSLWSTNQRQHLRDATQLIGEGRSPWSAVDGALDGSLLRLLESSLTASTVATLCNDVEFIHTELPQRLWEECQAAMDDLCSAMALVLHRAIENLNPLVSEIDLEDVLHAAEKLLLNEPTKKAFRWVTIATEVMRGLHPSLLNTSSPLPSKGGLSRLVQVFYPYLINQRRDKLLDSWHRVVRLFITSASIDLDTLAFLLNPICKLLLLNVAYLRRVCADEETELATPKLTVVCDRTQVLESSLAVVYKKCLAPHEIKPLPCYQLFPFFKSSFGEKVVDSTHVEEGEGKGPLKEWFLLVAAQMTAKWRTVQLPARDANEFDHIVVNGNKLVVDGLDADLIKPGYKVEWDSPLENDVTVVSRIVNKCDVIHGTYMLDRGSLANQSFPVSALRVWQPQVAYLEYIQASESYWFNEAITDTPANRHVLEFTGWFLANALVHQCALQLRLHRLFYELLLTPHSAHNQERRLLVTLQDLAALDPSLYEAMQQMKRMKPAEFVSFLEFEGLSSSLSLDDYITQTLDQKYGPRSNVAWQLDELWRGFRRVYSDADLRTVGLSADDLIDQLSGGGNSDDAKQAFDFETVFRVSLDPDFASCAPLRRAFWLSVNAFDAAMKRKLVKFITGVDTLPQPGTEFLRIEMPFPAMSPQDYEKTLRMLPQSHTCDNTLELPHYWRALCWKAKHDAAQPSDPLETELVALLTNKLQLAVEYSAGYGLDGTTAGTSAATSLASILPRSQDDQLSAAQESYDSLDLPALGEGSFDGGGGRESRTPMDTRTDTGDKMSGDPETTVMRRDEELHLQLIPVVPVTLDKKTQKNTASMIGKKSW